MKKIAIVEDDLQIREELKTLLDRYGYESYIIRDFTNVVDTLLHLNPDVVLLDINLPVFDGYYICREIRKQSAMPILVVTSRDNEWDELMSMNLGADDFVTKPYNTQILLARIANLYKRSQTNGDSFDLTYQTMVLSLQQAILQVDQRSVVLTKNEMNILALLMQKQGSIVTREELMERLWNADAFVDESTLSVNITRLRKKMKEVSDEYVIETRRGLGYCLR